MEETKKVFVITFCGFWESKRLRETRGDVVIAFCSFIIKENGRDRKSCRQYFNSVVFENRRDSEKQREMSSLLFAALEIVKIHSYRHTPTSRLRLLK
jgi:hypothetical protein